MPYFSTDEIVKDNGNAALSSLSLMCFIVFGLFASHILAVVSILPFHNFSIQDAFLYLGNLGLTEADIVQLYLIQGTSTLVLFVAIPAFHLKVIENKSLFLFFKKSFSPFEAGAVILIGFSFMAALVPVIEWNKNIVLPNELAGIENLMKSMEDRADKLTQLLTSFTDLPTLILAIFVIGVIPAVGEEILFRGLIQNYMQRAMRNLHAAIWVTAFLFGFFHLQFYGLFPRIFLGALFGYIYYWTGNIKFAMLGHFFNNTFTLLMIYFYNIGWIEFNIDNTRDMNWMVISLFFITCCALIYRFRSYCLDQAHKNG